MKIALINASPKRGNSASKIILQTLEKRLTDVEITLDVEITCYDSASGDASALLHAMSGCNALVFAFPLYVDGIPANLLRQLEQICPSIAQAAPQAKVYTLVNNGFYDGCQNTLALEMMQHFTQEANLTWGQGIGIGAGSMVQGIPIGSGPFTRLGKTLDALAETILQRRSFENITLDPNLPRFLYKQIANMSWRPQAKKNGLKRSELYKRH
ncbi:NAD(P)H-dependent oxidoreductase [Dehalobacterium formicoaceticum]|uniref:NAD(P)H-dependent oxidoreductase n=1 Tax=Dehalobacterium formicoaceticum TaxID=51515 RepID=UPI000B7D064B|nr:NAD(P)H-dependent oxidoreductase [Dehalobacterium formicoaceticum]